MSSRYFDNGQYDLSKLLITTNTSSPIEIDVSKSFKDVVIYESIYNECISGNISFIDTTNVVNEYSLGNRESIEIQFNTAGISDVKKYKGVIYKVSPPVRTSDHSTGYTLHFASEEMLNSISKKVFTGYNEEISGIVQKLYDSVKRQKDPKTVDINKTRNIENFVFTGVTTFAAINKIANKSISTNENTGFVFYEDMDKFRFASLEELYKADPVTEYVYKNSGTFENIKNKEAEAFNAYQDFEPIDGNSHAQSVMDGMYGSTWARFSILNKNLEVFNYNTKEQYDPSKSLGKSPVELNNNFNTSYSDKLYLSYCGAANNNLESYVKTRMNKLRSMNSGFSIGAFGDSSIRVGNTCIANIPNWSSNGMQPTGADRDVLTGKFLIAEIKHVLTPSLYTQRIKLNKDAYEGVLA